MVSAHASNRISVTGRIVGSGAKAANRASASRLVKAAGLASLFNCSSKSRVFYRRSSKASSFSNFTGCTTCTSVSP